MSTPSGYTPVGSEGGGGQFNYADYDDAHGQGLVTFAGVMIMIAATLNCLYGIAAIDSAHVFVNNAKYVFGDLNTWGWFLVAFGVLQFFGRFAIRRRPSGGRRLRVGCAGPNGILQTLWIPAF